MLDGFSKEECLKNAIEIAKAHAQSTNPKTSPEIVLEDSYNVLKKLKEDTAKKD